MNMIKNGTSWKKLFKRSLPILLGLLTGIVTVGLFVATRSDVIHIISNTAYPGQRTVASGHMDYLHIFDSFLLPQLQSGLHGANFFVNQSEASNFIMLAPFLILPALALIFFDYRKSKKFDWTFIFIQIGVVIFLARMFLPYGDSFYKLLMLGSVPHQRLIIGLGFLGIIQIILILKKLDGYKDNPFSLLVRITYSVVCAIILLLIGLKVSNEYPLFIGHPLKISLLAFSFAAIVFLILSRKLILSSLLILLFSIGCIIKIHPLYVGLGWINNNDLFKSVQKVSQPNSNWGVADSIIFENLPLIAQRDNIGGVQPYPDNTFWALAGGDNKDDTYNRFAHILFTSSPSFSGPLHLAQSDLFEVNLTCNSFIRSNISYVLSISKIYKPCLVLKDTVNYPSVTFYIYRIK